MSETSVSKNDSDIATIKTVSQFLSADEYLKKEGLHIPVYQRPYRWSQDNITDLLNDLSYQCKRIGHSRGDPYHADNAYRLGTIVLHKEFGKDEDVDNSKSQLNIVDGQQRTLTLMLILNAAKSQSRFKEQFKHFTLAPIVIPDCKETHHKLTENLTIIKRYVARPEFTPDVLHFLLNQCEIVQVTLNDLSEAFQFFDSQNARGLDLKPHDLLKAFHLREFAEAESSLKESVVESWEQKDTKQLSLLFSNYLYPIRQWSNGKNGMYYSKLRVSSFKGVSLQGEAYAFQQGLNLIHNTVDSYNQHPHRRLDTQTMTYPFQLTQTIINGRRFFEWVSYYQQALMPLLHNTLADNDHNWLVAVLTQQPSPQSVPNSKAFIPISLTILQVINGQLDGEYAYKGKGRQGDKYVRRLFNALVLCYYDRFGTKDLARAIEYIFIWVYSLRLQQASVYHESVEKHIRNNNQFARLQQSLSPASFINKPLKELTLHAKLNLSAVTGLTTLFEKLGYINVVQPKESSNAL